MRFLVLSSHAWQDIRQRPHHLMARFAAAGHEVLWVQPRYLRWLLNDCERFARVQDAEPAPNLHVKTVTLVNGERFGPIRAWNKLQLRQAMQMAMQQNQTPIILWIYNSHEVHLADSVPHDLLIYDIMDEYRGFPWAPRNIATEEASLLAKADWIFAGTHALFESKRPQANERIECILSGVETAHFAPPQNRSKNQSGKAALNAINLRAAEWVAQHEFIIGYAGMLDLRLDEALIAGLARAFPRWGFMVLGPVASDLSTLAAAPNIFMPGAIDYADLPTFYHAWDIAWLPFVENELTRHINPTKMLEYAAADLPIVARALPDVARFYAEGAWLYQNAGECREILMKLAADPDLRRSRLPIARTWAAERDWDALAARMLKRIEALLRKKPAA